MKINIFLNLASPVIKLGPKKMQCKEDKLKRSHFKTIFLRSKNVKNRLQLTLSVSISSLQRATTGKMGPMIRWRQNIIMVFTAWWLRGFFDPGAKMLFRPVGQ